MDTGWLEGEGGYTYVHGDRNAHGVSVDSCEVAGGVQKTFCRDLTAGVAGSYECDHIHYRRGGTGKNSTWLVGLYGLYRPACYYGLLDLSCGVSSNALKRAIHVGPLDYIAHSRPKMAQCAFYGELGVDCHAGCFLLQPFVGIEAGKCWRRHVTEREKHGWGLHVDRKQWASASSRLGMHATTHSLCGDVELSMDLAWNRLLSSRHNKITARFIEFGSDYAVTGLRLDSDSIDYALTLSKPFFDGLNAYFEVAGESWKRASNYNLIAGFEFNW